MNSRAERCQGDARGPTRWPKNQTATVRRTKSPDQRREKKRAGAKGRSGEDPVTGVTAQVGESGMARKKGEAGGRAD